MKLFMPMAAGSDCRWISLLAAASLGCGLLVAGSVYAGVYRYQDESGQWVFSDRQPQSGQDYELAETQTGAAPKESVRIWRQESREGASILARNDAVYPVEVAAWLVSANNLRAMGVDDGARAVLAAGEQREVLRLAPLAAERDWGFEFASGHVPGDPQARHDDSYIYRPPFAPALSYRITQAYPQAITHVTPDSEHAIDIDMPAGAGVFAARDGLVVEVAYSNFRGGLDMQRFGQRANLVRILHSDGSFAVYAHLSWDSIRVRPGEQVARGQPIAAAGSTGFSSGPHLHFVVLRNAGLKTVSVPVRFADGAGGSQVPESGAQLRNP